MGAAEVWAGLTDSAFLSRIGEREREPARIIVTVLGGLLLGLLAATCAMLLILVAYALLTGQGGRGLDGVLDAARAIGDVHQASPALSLMRLAAAAGVDGGLLIVFVALAAALARQPLHVYITAAAHIRWRLLAVGMALSVAAIGPVIVVDRLLSTDGPAPPFLAISPLAGDRLAYVLSSLLLIPAAAAEELFFRGWLMRQAGAFLRRPMTLILFTALVFSALHFDFAPDAFLTRALMGAGFAYMTLRLGGVECSSGVHSVNNIAVLLFIQPLTLEAKAAGPVSAWSLVEDLALVGGYVLITELVARLPALQRLAGVRPEEISPARDVSAHFS